MGLGFGAEQFLVHAVLSGWFTKGRGSRSEAMSLSFDGACRADVISVPDIVLAAAVAALMGEYCPTCLTLDVRSRVS